MAKPKLRTSTGVKITGSRSKQAQSMRAARGATARARRAGGGYSGGSTGSNRSVGNTSLRGTDVLPGGAAIRATQTIKRVLGGR